MVQCEADNKQNTNHFKINLNEEYLRDIVWTRVHSSLESNPLQQNLFAGIEKKTGTHRL